MAALLGAVLRSERMVSAVWEAFLRPTWSLELSTASWSNSSLSKIFRREGRRGGVERGARSRVGTAS